MGTSWASCQWLGTESRGSETIPHRNLPCWWLWACLCPSGVSVCSSGQGASPISESSFIHSFMPLSIQEILIERLLSARHCSKGCNTARNQTDRNCPRGLTLVRDTRRNRLRDGDRRSQGHRGTNRREGATERGSETARDTERMR